MELLKRYGPGLLLIFVLVGAAVWANKRPPKVEVVKVATDTLTEVLAVSGQVRGRTDSQLAPEAAGTISEVLVKEGEQVKQGQILAKLNQDRLLANREQAAKQVDVAAAQLEVARRGPLPSELEEVRSEAARREQVAAAALESARQGLKEARVGPREEQVKQAAAELERARAEQEQRKRDLSRQKELYQQGAVSQQAFEQAQTAEEQASASVESARQRLTELQVGTRPEQLEQARQDVARAEAELAGAKRTGESQVQQLLDRPRPEDVELARAQLEQARAAYEVAEEQLAQSVLKAPYDGVIGRKLLDEGDQAGPNAPIFTMASLPGLEIRVDIDESERSRVKLGQLAEVRAPGFPDSFQAKVTEFAGEIDSVQGTLEARLFPEQTPEWLVPGQTVDVNILLSAQSERLLVPLTSVSLIGNGAKVLMVENGRLKEREVQVSSPTEKGYLIQSGLEAGEQVVRYPQGLQDGAKVRGERGDWP
ncbi:MAG: efflux RND transporter periplasmic adaptor subunit [Candidatus Eremiobacteraeota bacterium]|nr:efflux RND transporter periplasmic adaptor subunit [Candidatus Eremiobacteraeota bacterium]